MLGFHVAPFSPLGPCIPCSPLFPVSPLTPCIPCSPLSPLSPFGPLILVVVGGLSDVSLVQVKLPSSSTEGFQVSPLSPFCPTPATAKELNEQYSGWSFNHVTVPY